MNVLNFYQLQTYFQITPIFKQDDEDPCSFTITMLRPNCELPCSVNVQGNVIDLRPLKKFGDITVPSENGAFYFR